MRLHLDFETYSESNIKEVGTYRYCADPSTEALMLGWAIDDETPQVWDIAAGEDLPLRLAQALLHCDVWAFNATFERLMLGRIGVHLPVERFFCTMVLAYSLSFAGSLDQCLARFNIPHRKDQEGKRLIHRFSKPQPTRNKVRRWTAENSPEDWARFKYYCSMDVFVERALYHRCMLTGVKVHWAGYHLDQQINNRGVPVDMELVNRAIEACEIEKAHLSVQAREITGLDNPNSVAQLRPWVETHWKALPNMQKATIAEALNELGETERYVEVKQVLTLRQQMAKTSTSKWEALARSQCDGKVKGAFQFVGAGRTGRWAGRIAQLHNWPRPAIKTSMVAVEALLTGGHPLVAHLYERPMDVYSSLLRSAIVPVPSEKLVVADLSSIESRLAGWVTGCKPIMDVFAEGRDVYIALAAAGLGKPEDQVTKEERTFYKPAALGAQYYLSGRGLVAYAADMGVEIDPVAAKHQIDVYRDTYSEVVEFWHKMNQVYLDVCQTGRTQTAYRMEVSREDQFLTVTLPSRRKIWYYLPLAEMGKTPWGEPKMVFTYMGKHKITGQWVRLQSHGGLLLENIVQAIARDILLLGLMRAERIDLLTVLGHVHDEIIGMSPWPEEALVLLNEALSTPPSWAPDLLLGSAGYIAARYKKG